MANSGSGASQEEPVLEDSPADSAPGAPLGPGSILWNTAGDPRSLLPGTAAGIMQLMLPGLGAGVSDHSNFFEDPFDRIFRSIPVIWGSIFAEDDEEGDSRGHHIRDLHRDIKGTDSDGKRYHALDPDVFWWAHATFTWEFLRASGNCSSPPAAAGRRSSSTPNRSPGTAATGSRTPGSAHARGVRVTIR
ncbi:MAG: oxygenase MpaB family protein [Microthrixaceae bacterium]